MASASTFADFIRRIRAGEAGAIEELVRLHEPVIRLEVRSRLRAPGLRRLFDSMDICQSVLVGFLVRAQADCFDLAEPRDLVKLLVGITRNKLAARVRYYRQKRRDTRREEAADPRWEAAADAPSPSRLFSAREELERVQRRLSAEERQLLELRQQGMEWAEIAARLGGTPQARRKQLDRALDRVTAELDPDGDGVA
jgi:RNA polymerase sigma-70 factor (ECF subfamily)